MTRHTQPPSHRAPTDDGLRAAAGGSLPDGGAIRQSLRVGAVLSIAGAAGYMLATPLLHPGGGTPIGEFQLYAESTTWAAAHVIQFACTVLVACGVLAFAHGLNVRSGVPGLVNRFAAATAAALVAINGALYAVDGIALKTAVNAWDGSPPATRPAFLAAVEAVRGVEFGLRGYVAYTTGLALVLLAAVIISTARVPRVIGYLVGLTGLVYLAQGVGWSALRTVVSEHALEGDLGYYAPLLILAWSIWLLVLARRRRSGTATG